MSDEPKREIEKLIESYAQKRRNDAGAPLELHPVTRRMLQDEVARRTKPGATAGKSFFESFFNTLRPRWAYAATMIGVFALLAAIVIPSLRHGRQENALSESEGRGAGIARMKKTASGAELAQSAATPPPTASPPTAANADELSELSVNAKSKTAEGLTPAEVARDARSPSLLNTDGGIEGGGAMAVKERRLGIAPLPTESDRLDRSDTSFPAAAAQTSPGESRNATAHAAGKLNAPSASSAVKDTTKLEVKQVEESVALSRRTDTSLADRASPSSTTPVSKTTATVNAAGGKLPAATSSSEERGYFASSDGKEKAAPRRYVQSVSSLKQNNRESAAVTDLPVAAPPTVLASFDFEQEGEDIRITDADGSVYSGKIQPQPVRLGAIVAPSPSGGDTLAAPAASPKDAPAQSELMRRRYGLARAAPQQGIAFRVEGTNRSLNQLVVLNGNVLLDTNAVMTLATNVTAALNFGAQAEPPPVRGQSTVPASRITGNARLENGVEIQIDAAAQQRTPAGPASPLKK